MHTNFGYCVIKYILIFSRVKKFGNPLQPWDMPVSAKIILPVSVTDRFRLKQNRLDLHFRLKLSGKH